MTSKRQKQINTHQTESHILIMHLEHLRCNSYTSRMKSRPNLIQIQYKLLEREKYYLSPLRRHVYTNSEFLLTTYRRLILQT